MRSDLKLSNNFIYLLLNIDQNYFSFFIHLFKMKHLFFDDPCFTSSILNTLRPLLQCNSVISYVFFYCTPFESSLCFRAALYFCQGTLFTNQILERCFYNNIGHVKQFTMCNSCSQGVTYIVANPHNHPLKLVLCIITVLQMKNLRCGQVGYLAQGYASL